LKRACPTLRFTPPATAAYQTLPLRECPASSRRPCR
jgi:hypothetical protein